MRLGQDKIDVIRQKLFRAFPDVLRKDIEVVFSFLQNKKFDIHTSAEYEQEIILNGEKLTLIGRTYFEDIEENQINTLSNSQKTILYCLFLRNSNGFIRQKYLERLSENKDYFVTPYIFILLGEYVVEILFIAEKNVKMNIENYLKFKIENPIFFRRTESRMISYWNEYYRFPKYPKIKEYIGSEIFNKINKP